MLFVGSDDGVYRAAGIFEPDGPTVEQVCQTGRVVRLQSPDGVQGLFAATMDGLYHTHDGDRWAPLGVPREQVYAVAARPDGRRFYAGTRPAHLYVADLADGVGSEVEWRELHGFRALPSTDNWGIDRHDNRAQVRDIVVPDEAPDRVVVGVEVAGVFVSDDGGETWTDRRIDEFDAPHTDDIHSLRLEDSDTILAATGSGLYRTTDVGRNWTRLDDASSQSYFRDACVHRGVCYAGAAPAPPSNWNDESDHALFKVRGDKPLDVVPSPVSGEVAVSWSRADGRLLSVTDRGTLLQCRSGDWKRLGSLPVPESVHGRCLPLSWAEF